MSGLLPSETETRPPDGDDGTLRVLPLDDDDAAQLINCLASDTARSTLAALQENPATASELADDVETSLQNVRHHLDNLRDAELVRVVDTRYSVKGREMKVYAPARDSLVVCVGDSADIDHTFE
ncbi:MULTISPECIES: winged helix-turn-helix domain-containing protein [Halobellus]|uniref:ArsR/SmtB family transcription factor n=1 Tax=Halobellus TaxID=1073986 RepID=UPI002115167C|nr:MULTISPECIES: winged helix-turn-helix domain-containing protein [Halobellus]MDQ2053424.1 winged helix-turn-helix domain-containing protein [Halobellus sp. H-GB7]